MHYKTLTHMDTLTLKEYEDIAKEFLKSVSRLCTPYHRAKFLSDESIGIVVQYLINADSKYDNTKGASIVTYRYRGMLNAKHAITKSWKKQQKSIETYDTSFDYSSAVQPQSPVEELVKVEEANDKHKLVNNMVDSSVLTETERKYMRLIYVDGLSKKEIASRMKVSPQSVYFFEKKALGKLKEAYAKNTV